jgi:hypothetical protein
MSRWEELLGKFARGIFRGATRKGYATEFAPRPAVESFGHAARFAFRLFKDNCIELPWIAEGSAIDDAVDGARADLLRSWNVYRSSKRRQHAETDWQQVLTTFRRTVSDLNRRIAAYNLKAPSSKFRRPPLDAEQEIRRTQRLK